MCVTVYTLWFGLSNLLSLDRLADDPDHDAAVGGYVVVGQLGRDSVDVSSGCGALDAERVADVLVAGAGADEFCHLALRGR